MTGLQQKFTAALSAYAGETLLDAPLSAYCSFKIGGPAEILYVPRSEDALLAALRFAKNEGAPCRVLGNGSNVLISD